MEMIHVNKEFQPGLQGFEEVWKRVRANREKSVPAGLMPGKKPKSRAVRFGPPQR
ncbi:MAG: hypothetical protein SO014_08265 [Candidatus Limivicinus sp.]|nr:hypothetical protein [Candidatus Limivicinus sp.]